MEAVSKDRRAAPCPIRECGGEPDRSRTIDGGKHGGIGEARPSERGVVGDAVVVEGASVMKQRRRHHMGLWRNRERHRRDVAVCEEDVIRHVGKGVRAGVVHRRRVDEGAVVVELQRPVCRPAYQARRQRVAEVRVGVVGQHALRNRRDVERGTLEDRVRVVVGDRRVIDRQHVDEEGVGDGQEWAGPAGNTGGTIVRRRDPDRELAPTAGGREHVVIRGSQNTVRARRSGLEFSEA